MSSIGLQEKSPQHILAEESIRVLEEKYKEILEINPALDRSLVSFQANKSEPIFRWFHYREGFSKQLIEYIIDTLNIPQGGQLLDPFAGTGVAPFVASNINNMRGIAIELMPVGVFFMQCRNAFSSLPSKEVIKFAKETISNRDIWKNIKPSWKFNHLKITEGAFSESCEYELCQFKTWISSLQDENYKVFLNFVAFTILEKFSFTRKDGQYLRWDHRSPRFEKSDKKKKFDKGEILNFYSALKEKLIFIIDDLEKNSNDDAQPKNNKIDIIEGTVLKEINNIDNESIDVIITSPPYCNRYDYTRTYALELAYLGVTEEKIRSLRQTLLTCTVENKPKEFEWIERKTIENIDIIFSKQKCLQDVINFLKSEAELGKLNNKGIQTMVKGYFYDSAVHLSQAASKMKSGSYYIMINDNVKYNGLDIPVDLLLSEIAFEFGLKTEKIWVLPKGKGNSSQQMKKHGRSELRKCIYIWKKA
ncbi:hypothetical protein SOASR030_00160 [Leminorella grimontii]|uniref:site-specific DNA-methyltransferase (cytosine-N(4)-specific) n=1 Tax=Leminorella grimontii TaxID=82981 RepID=A0AAV5MWW9_9GAMM|nr:restriction endonuclease AvaI [Leminorella grimontii]KFC95522.1 modification methylase [Leminorella grimontii ATCC 33999 = DSM 5078]GKX53904.1 hypothetical protein SOASR030_00160 [Leminorella grimontii]VFS60622.1 putative methyltransferase [Leminorella grimontii]